MGSGNSKQNIDPILPQTSISSEERRAIADKRIARLDKKTLNYGTGSIPAYTTKKEELDNERYHQIIRDWQN